jgi:hypothetical protein
VSAYAALAEGLAIGAVVGVLTRLAIEGASRLRRPAPREAGPYRVAATTDAEPSPLAKLSRRARWRQWRARRRELAPTIARDKQDLVVSWNGDDARTSYQRRGLLYAWLRAQPCDALLVVTCRLGGQIEIPAHWVAPLQRDAAELEARELAREAAYARAFR